MKMFVFMVNYTQPFEKVEEILPIHRDYLKQWYAKGHLLASGPRNPKTGGLIIGKFVSKEEAIDFSNADPFCIHSVASYEIIEFDPVLHASCLKEFLQGF